MSVIVNEGAAVGQSFALKAYPGFSKRTQPDLHDDHGRRFDAENAAALGNNRGCIGGRGRAIFADRIGAAENAIVRARNGVHQWGIVADNRLRQIELRHNHDLTAVGFQFRIASQFACADAGAIDDHIKIARNFLHLINMSRLNCAAGVVEPVGQVIEVDRGVDQGDVEGVAVGKNGGQSGNS